VLADPPREEIDRLTSRRDLVKVALLTTGALAAACAAAPLALFLRPPSHERSPRGDVLLADIGLEQAEAGDVVLVAGKGHETEQLQGAERRPFDDRAVALELLGGRG